MRLVGFIDPEANGTPKQHVIGNYEVYPLSSVEHILQNQVIDEVIFAVSMQELARLEPVILHCANLGIKVRVQLEFLPAAYSRVYLEKFRDLELLSLSSTPESELLLFFKRAFDVAFATCSLVVLAPLMACVAAAIRVTSPGPVLFKQTRCGLGGRRFTLYKFRSMINNAEQLKAELHQLNELNGPVFKLRDDPRITSVGRWLRRFSIDELPQLWNIVRGDMSFVGPRPAIPAEVDQYEPWQRRRLAHATGPDLHLGAGRPQSSGVQSLDSARPGLHRYLVAVAGCQDLLPHHPHRAFRPRSVLERHGFDHHRHLEFGSSSARVPGLHCAAGLSRH